MKLSDAQQIALTLLGNGEAQYVNIKTAESLHFANLIKTNPHDFVGEGFGKQIACMITDAGRDLLRQIQAGTPSLPVQSVEPTFGFAPSTNQDASAIIQVDLSAFGGRQRRARLDWSRYPFAQLQPGQAFRLVPEDFPGETNLKKAVMRLVNAANKKKDFANNNVLFDFLIQKDGRGQAVAAQIARLR
jgi:hypothetical protein